MLLDLNWSHPTLPREQPFFQISDQSASSNETWQIRLAIQHHFHQKNYLLRIFLKHLEAFCHSFPEIVEFLAVLTTEYLDHLVRKLERRLFHCNTLSWCITQQKAEVDMTNVALNVNHNVAIVSIFDLKDVANQRVRRQTIAKIIPRLLEFV